MKYRFSEKQHPKYPVGQQCHVLGVSRSGYYAWRERQKQQKKQDALRALIAHIHRIHRKSRRTYGSPRVHAELRAEGVLCNHKRVARLMRLEGIQGRRKRRKGVTTDRRNDYPVERNQLNRKFG